MLSRKINGEIIYPRPQQTPVVEVSDMMHFLVILDCFQMVRLYYYVESLHGQWLSSETVLCRKEGSTKFAIQFEKGVFSLISYLKPLFQPIRNVLS